MRAVTEVQRIPTDGACVAASSAPPLTERSTHNGRRHRGRLLRAVPPRVVVHFCRRDQRRQPAYHTICAGARGPCAKTIKTNCESERAHLHVRVVCQSQATHTRLRDEINRSRESAPHGQTVQHARTRSQLVALRASLMEAHINGMLLAADGASQPS